MTDKPAELEEQLRIERAVSLAMAQRLIDINDWDAGGWDAEGVRQAFADNCDIPAPYKMEVSDGQAR